MIRDANVRWVALQGFEPERMKSQVQAYMSSERQLVDSRAGGEQMRCSRENGLDCLLRP